MTGVLHHRASAMRFSTVSGSAFLEADGEELATLAPHSLNLARMTNDDRSEWLDGTVIDFHVQSDQELMYIKTIFLIDVNGKVVATLPVSPDTVRRVDA